MGHATMDVELGGFFDLAGNPNLAGPLECDSFGETYEATRDG